MMGLSLGVLIGAPFGGFFAEIGGPHLPFIILGCLVILDGFARWLLLASPKDTSSSDNFSEKIQQDSIFKSVRRVLLDFQLWLVALSFFLGNGAIASMEVNLPLFLSQQYGLSSGFIALIYGCGTLSYTISMFIIGRVFGTHIPRWVGIMLGLLIMGIFLSIFLLIDHLAWNIFCWVFIGIGMALIDGCANPELADIADKRHPGNTGTVFGFGSSLTDVGFIVGPLVGTGLVYQYGYRINFTVFGVILIVLSPFGFLYWRGEKKYKQLKEEKIMNPEISEKSTQQEIGTEEINPEKPIELEEIEN